MLVASSRILDELNNAKAEIADTAVLINGCSDEFTKISIEANNVDMEYFEVRIVRLNNLIHAVLYLYVFGVIIYIV